MSFFIMKRMRFIFLLQWHLAICIRTSIFFMIFISMVSYHGKLTIILSSSYCNLKKCRVNYCSMNTSQEQYVPNARAKKSSINRFAFIFKSLLSSPPNEWLTAQYSWSFQNTMPRVIPVQKLRSIHCISLFHMRTQPLLLPTGYIRPLSSFSLVMLGRFPLL